MSKTTTGLCVGMAKHPFDTSLSAPLIPTVWINTDPAKKEALAQCWFNAGPTSATLNQHGKYTIYTRQVTRDVGPTLLYVWATICDDVKPLRQRCTNTPGRMVVTESKKIN